jgi:hypothetical protein
VTCREDSCFSDYHATTKLFKNKFNATDSDRNPPYERHLPRRLFDRDLTPADDRGVGARSARRNTPRHGAMPVSGGGGR